ncbi:MAG: MarR family winged helix-turn-helix transcriptional regulator [Thaumarchaeota archaeon]|nr:MarR family winged helix-turn-helix transcriptional regulator [Nitrososphaerota archaeon]
MPALAEVLEMGSPRAPGPAPTYSPSHVLAVLMTIGDVGSIGRGALAKESGLGDGAVRTVIRRLGSGGYIVVRPVGCQLTGKGKVAYDELRKRIPKTIELTKTSLTLGDKQVALLIRGAGEGVKSGIEQRDASIKAGAVGASTYVIRGSKFQVPGSSLDCEADFPSDAWRKVRRELRPLNGDAIVICGSGERNTSLIGAISAAITLLT